MSWHWNLIKCFGQTTKCEKLFAIIPFHTKLQCKQWISVFVLGYFVYKTSFLSLIFSFMSTFCFPSTELKHLLRVTETSETYFRIVVQFRDKNVDVVWQAILMKVTPIKSVYTLKGQTMKRNPLSNGSNVSIWFN